MLLSSGANVDVEDCCGCTPLFNACGGNQYENVELLLQAGANMFIANDSGETPLMYARRCQRHECADILKNWIPRIYSRIVVQSEAPVMGLMPLAFAKCDKYTQRIDLMHHLLTKCFVKIVPYLIERQTNNRRKIDTDRVKKRTKREA